MIRTKPWRALAFALPLAAASAVASGCGGPTKTVSATSDEHVCIYDTDEDDGQRLIAQLPPGSEGKDVEDDAEVVSIPASNRFFMASRDANRDPGAPLFYKASARGNVRVRIQGQVRFKFNLDRACEWYAKHGRRNARDGSLGFNARGEDAASCPSTCRPNLETGRMEGEVVHAGWLKWLPENFGTTMQQVATERTNAYAWPALTYNYAVNANDLGDVKGKPGEPTLIAYGVDIGAVFTERLRDNIGGEYFCGVDPSIVEGEDSACPPMYFQAVDVEPVQQELVTAREAIEKERQALATSEIEAKIAAQHQNTQLKAEERKQALLKEQAETARLEALIANAKCLPLARLGLDCEGKRPTVVVGGTTGGQP